MADLLFDKGSASNGDAVFGDDGSSGSVYVPSTDLVFDAPPTGADLVFELESGADTGVPATTPVTVDLVLPGPAVATHVSIAFPVSFAFALAGPAPSVHPVYVSGANRPTVAKVGTGWQAGVPKEVGADARHQLAAKLPTGADMRWQAARTTEILTNIVAQQAEHLQDSLGVRYQQGQGAEASATLRHQEAVYQRTSSRTGWQEAVPVGGGLGFRYQEALRDRRNRTAVNYQQALRHTGRVYTGRVSDGKPIVVGRVLRYQEAWPPRPGRSISPIVVPPDEPCYTPSGHLVFSTAWDGSSDLVFVCDGHGDEVVPPDATVVVPIRRVYVVLNSSTLRRVDGNVAIPTFGMSLSLDRGSWTWSFSASVPLQAQATVVSDEPVEVEASINGVPYRFIVESVSRERTFGSMPSLRLTGRGKSALLDAPYAPIMSFGNTEARTAQQLMADVLTTNGVSLGWDIDWDLVDWNVPAGVFAHQGSYISALNTIAQAAGGYVQPVPVADGLRVLHSYPVVPWEWDTVTPDFELPADLTTREGIDWVKKPVVDRVWVSGTAQGVLGRYTRAGTAGELLAPPITDALITHVDAVRQRGRVPVAEGGTSIQVGLRLPVLAETGLIPPGKWVRYVDGGVSRFGLTRSVSVDVGETETWQSIMVETR